MITGAHAILYSTDADADRAFLRDVLGFPHVDVGHGWLIFGLPPSEVAVHPGDANGMHELYLMTDDIEQFVADMQARGLACGAVSSQGWGLLTQLTLPGGGQLGVYQPRHASPPQAKGKPARPTAKPRANARAGRKPGKPRPAKRPAPRRPATKRPARATARRRSARARA